MAIWSPHTGVVDFNSVAHSFGTDLLKSGGRIIFGFEVCYVCMLASGLILCRNPISWWINSLDIGVYLFTCLFSCCDYFVKIIWLSSTPRIR